MFSLLCLQMVAAYFAVVKGTKETYEEALKNLKTHLGAFENTLTSTYFGGQNTFLNGSLATSTNFCHIYKSN